jgi:hypothetical protein
MGRLEPLNYVVDGSQIRISSTPDDYVYHVRTRALQGCINPQIAVLVKPESIRVLNHKHITVCNQLKCPSQTGSSSSRAVQDCGLAEQCSACRF